MNQLNAENFPGASRLPTHTIQDFVAGFLVRKQGFLKAAEAFGSPLYLLEPAVLSERAAQFRRAFETRLPKTSFYYAVKSNSLPYISEILLAQGYGLDVSSGLELASALDIGAEDIIFSGPGKTNAELEMAADHHDRVTLLLDSAGEYRRLAAVLDHRKHPRINVGIRLNNNPEGLWRKFGIPLRDLTAVYEEIRHHPRIHFRGLQFHSSWNLTPGRQVEFIETLGETLRTMPDHFLRSCGFIDIGGGYWPSRGEWLLSGEPGAYLLNAGVSIDIFAKRLSAVIKEKILPLADCRICFEPGRWLCNDAMHILIRVIDRKAPDLVITDAGTNAVGWERFETDYFPVLNLTRSGINEKQCHILGSLCTPHDVWGYAYFGIDIREGDILMIPTQGAYTYSLRQHFIKPLPHAAVIEKDGRSFLLPATGLDSAPATI